MSGINGDYQSLAEAVGEAPPRPLSWTAEEMADWDENDMEAAMAAMDRDIYERSQNA